MVIIRKIIALALILSGPVMVYHSLGFENDLSMFMGIMFGVALVMGGITLFFKFEYFKTFLANYPWM